MALTSAVRIEIDGQEIMDFTSLSINQNMKGVHEFQVCCRMDTFEEPDTFIMDQSKKHIGSNMVIAIDNYKVGSDESEQGLFFKGIIHSIRAIKSDLTNEDQIILSGFSPDILLNDHAGCRSFENKSLKQIVDEVLQPYPRDVLKTNVNPNYKEQILYCVQYQENTLEFLQRLAARYGEWMYYNGSELVFGALKSKQEELILDEDLNNFNYSLNLKAPGIKYVSYDYLNAERYEANSDDESGKNQQNEPGKYAHDQSAKKYTSAAVVNYPHLNIEGGNYAKAQKKALELETSSISLGMSTIEGQSENMKLLPGSEVTIKALKYEGQGEVDYGQYIIKSVQHHCDNLHNYHNSFTAIPAEAKVPDYTNPNAITHSAAQSAIVMDNNDPEQLGRIRVQFFWQKNKSMSPWLRLVTPYSGAERGFYFIPEIDDEVLVGFEGGDTERPFVMGSLYHGKHKPAGNFIEDNNSFKGIVTQSNLKIEFDDDKKVTTIETPGGNTVVLSDDDKSILLKDQNQNIVKLNSSGISMDSMEDIKITSKAKVIIDGTAGVDIKSTADTKVSGLNIKLNANATIAAKGNASAELSSVGNTTVKGTMVMIN